MSANGSKSTRRYSCVWEERYAAELVMVGRVEYVCAFAHDDMLDEVRAFESRRIGDVAFAEVAKKAGAITPVPGGVGPMTIAMLMSNTIKACRQITSSTASA